MNAPEKIETVRTWIRKPRSTDAEAIFSRYASDPEVTRYVAWPTHQSIEDTRTFLALSESQWNQWPAGPYLIESKSDGRLMGGTGLSFETHDSAQTGYVLAKDMWGMGYATETFRAITAIAPALGIRRLFALCHPEHHPSRHVLDKCGFRCESVLRQHATFPNLKKTAPCDVLCYVRMFV